jgi:hypothetical protein
MDKEAKKLYARIHNHALLRGGLVPEIGEVLSYRHIEHNGKITIAKLITFDWYENGKKDFFIFNEQGLVNNAIHPETREGLLEMYIKTLAKSPLEADFLEEVLSYFVFSEMGFFD